MAREGDAPARFPRQEVKPGQKHGYLGEVETYDPAIEGPGHTNTAADNAAERQKGTKGAKSAGGGTIGAVTPEDAGEPA